MEWHLKLGVCAAPDDTESMKRVQLSKLNCDISISDIDCPATMHSTMLRAREKYILQERARAKPRGEHPYLYATIMQENIQRSRSKTLTLSISKRELLSSALSRSLLNRKPKYTLSPSNRTLRAPSCHKHTQNATAERPLLGKTRAKPEVGRFTSTSGGYGHGEHSAFSRTRKAIYLPPFPRNQNDQSETSISDRCE